MNLHNFKKFGNEQKKRKGLSQAEKLCIVGNIMYNFNLFYTENK